MTARELAQLATAIENGAPLPVLPENGTGLIIGITGPPGAGKSTLVDALITEFRRRNKTVAAVCVDPSSRVTGGAVLGDRVRMQRHHADSGVYIRSMASRGATGGIARTTSNLAKLFQGAGFGLVLIETLGVGQDEIEIASHADATAVVLMPGAGDEVQAIKAGVMEAADLFIINKADLPGADLLEHDLDTMRPVFRTVATTGSGVQELADHLEKISPRTLAVTEQLAIDHLGVAVDSIDGALAFYSALGLQPALRQTIEQEGVHVAMLPAGDSRIELLEASNAESTVAKFIAKRGPGLHHVAIRVPDLNAALERLRNAGVQLLGEPQTGAGGHRYVFVHPKSTGGVLWELIQS